MALAKDYRTAEPPPLVTVTEYDYWRYHSTYLITKEEQEQSIYGTYNDFISILKEKVDRKDWEEIFWRLWNDEAFELSEYYSVEHLFDDKVWVEVWQ